MTAGLGRCRASVEALDQLWGVPHAFSCVPDLVHLSTAVFGGDNEHTPWCLPLNGEQELAELKVAPRMHTTTVYSIVAVLRNIKIMQIVMVTCALAILLLVMIIVPRSVITINISNAK